ncbi:root hair specific 2 [Striga hermonthica]|uniref:Protein DETOXIFICATION n=1 Tax=Striga hermonthica TaxID=68872 RepID=A0A9N7MS07_STRHE|nr:root hair specific 2 [Striga hermonthica]
MEDHNSKQPLLTQAAGHENDDSVRSDSLQRLSNPCCLSSFVADDDDIGPIKNLTSFMIMFKAESGKLWYLAGPAIFTSLTQYMLGAFTQTLAGHVSTLDLAAFSIENSVIAGLSLAFVDHPSRHCFPSHLPLHFRVPIFIAYRADRGHIPSRGEVRSVDDPTAFCVRRQLPDSQVLQAQSKIMAMAWISAVALLLHMVLSWLLMLRLGWGMAAGAAVLDISWWFIVIGQLWYVVSGACGRAWPGFTFHAFSNIWGFVRLSIESAIMTCLEIWYFMALILFAGYLKDAEVAVAALSICANILGWTTTISFGFNAAISVRVSNELGASRPRTARFSIVVMVIYSFLVGLFISTILLIFRAQYPSLFSNSGEVKQVVYELTPLLAFCIVVNSIQPGLSGVAIGAGWQEGEPPVFRPREGRARRRGEHQKPRFQVRRLEGTRDAPSSGEYQEHQAIQGEQTHSGYNPSAEIGVPTSCATVAMFQDTSFSEIDHSIF